MHQALNHSGWHGKFACSCTRCTVVLDACVLATSLSLYDWCACSIHAADCCNIRHKWYSPCYPLLGHDSQPACHDMQLTDVGLMMWGSWCEAALNIHVSQGITAVCIRTQQMNAAGRSAHTVAETIFAIATIRGKACSMPPRAFTIGFVALLTLCCWNDMRFKYLGSEGGRCCVWVWAWLITWSFPQMWSQTGICIATRRIHTSSTKHPVLPTDFITWMWLAVWLECCHTWECCHMTDNSVELRSGAWNVTAILGYSRLQAHV